MWPKRATIFGEDGEPKLNRFYLFGTGKTFGVFLHNFVGSDEPEQFHDHPWSWGLSLVLRGGYVEERRDPKKGTSARRHLTAGNINLLSPGIFHRVELPDARPAWTLFIHGPKVRKWGFLDAATGIFRFWQDASVGDPGKISSRDR